MTKLKYIVISVFCAFCMMNNVIAQDNTINPSLILAGQGSFFLTLRPTDTHHVVKMLKGTIFQPVEYTNRDKDGDLVCAECCCKLGISRWCTTVAVCTGGEQAGACVKDSECNIKK